MAESMSVCQKSGTEDVNVITMLDVLEEEQELEDDARAVLGGSDDKNCTYSAGYVKRQALYACKTCTAAVSLAHKPSGVCLACSYSCHEGHELIELYTKRNFRCDCGNGRFGNKKCNLEQGKSADNDLNSYNQNFLGLYCTCHRPYPDPDDDVEDEMIQCIVCEDWYHGRHLGSAIPSQHDYSEMVCGNCMSRHDFLWLYGGLFVTKVMSDDGSAPLHVTADVPATVCLSSNIVSAVTNSDSTPMNGTEAGTNNIHNNLKLPSQSGTEDCKDGCLIQGRELVRGSGAVFFSDGWRKNLCRCIDCQAMYMDQKVMFLTDEQDTVQAYEEQGKTRAQVSSQYERGMMALSSLDRVKQVEAIEEYNNMKTQLKDYLQKFAENKKVVREEDIREFFSGMEARKKQRLEIQIPHFCR